jgi:hypothetical protein
VQRPVPRPIPSWPAPPDPDQPSRQLDSEHSVSFARMTL